MYALSSICFCPPHQSDLGPGDASVTGSLEKPDSQDESSQDFVLSEHHQHSIHSMVSGSHHHPCKQDDEEEEEEDEDGSRCHNSHLQHHLEAHRRASATSRMVYDEDNDQSLLHSDLEEEEEHIMGVSNGHHVIGVSDSHVMDVANTPLMGVSDSHVMDGTHLIGVSDDGHVIGVSDSHVIGVTDEPPSVGQGLQYPEDIWGSEEHMESNIMECT